MPSRTVKNTWDDIQGSKAYGIDVSHWEGTIDWEEASQHVDFCIMKATDYPPFVDSEYMNNRTGCILNNVPWGVYHFYQPAIDPIDQAEHFIGVVGPDAPVYVADVEADTTGDWSPLLKDFLDRVEQLTGKKPMIYTSPYKWESFFPTPPWTDEYDLWVAHWGVQDPTLPNGWTDYVIHQIGDAGRIPGIPGAVDEDFFNGDLADVLEYFGVVLPPPPPPMIRIRVAAGYRLAAPIFYQPDQNAKVNGYAVHQSKWYAELVEGTDGRNYYRINQTGYIMARFCREI